MVTAVLPKKAFNQEVGRNLGRLIDAMDIPSRAAAAEEMGISRQRLNGWLNDGAPVDLFILYRWLRRRGVQDFNYLMWGDWSHLPSRIGRRIEAAIEYELQKSAEAAEAALKARAGQEV